MLNAERWIVQSEQIIGGGNKTVQMATVGFLNQIRKNLPPYGQRIVDHISVEAATEQPALAQEIAPLGEDTPISSSTANAQDSTMRLLHGLPYRLPKDAIFEDFVVVWLHDGNLEVQRIFKRGAVPTPDELNGLLNLGKHIGEILQLMGKQVKDEKGDKDSKAKLRKYEDIFKQLMNHVKALAQRMQQQMQAQAKQGAKGNGAQGDGKREAAIVLAQTKAQIEASRSRQKMQQRDQQFQGEERRKDQQTAAEIQRQGVRTRHELLANRLKALAE